LTQELKRPPRIDELARHLNISEESVVEIIESYNAYNIQSFSQNVYANDELELHEVIGDQDSTFERIENRDFLEKSLDKFSDVEKEFISMRYFDNKTQKTLPKRWAYRRCIFPGLKERYWKIQENAGKIDPSKLIYKQSNFCMKFVDA